MADSSSKIQPAATGELDERKAAILKAVVAEHIDTAQPVGSQSVASNDAVKVSSATVRSEMVALEREGFLVQPHTSAGRIPTDKGYRFFVDHLGRGVLSQPQHSTLANFFSHLRGEMEEVLHQTSQMLNELSSYTSVIIAPSHASATVRSVQLVDLGPRRCIVVAILSDGEAVRRTVELPFDVSPEQVSEASGQISSLLINNTLEQRVEVPSRDTPVATIVREAISSLYRSTPTFEEDRVYIGGSAKVADSFDSVETVRKVLGLLEQEVVVVNLLEDIVNQGLSVAIGSEHGYEPLSAAAVVVAPVTVDGEVAGAVGLLGPTRMNYPEALATAELVSEQLGQRLGDLIGER
jgi:heat-inducible transcriptional repressor